MSVTAQNLTLLTDLYELTMMQGYYKKGQHETVVFDVFYNKYFNNPMYILHLADFQYDR